MINSNNVKFYINTDTIDIRNSSIGVSNDQQRPSREFHIQVRHSGTQESVEQASMLARRIANLLNAENSLDRCAKEY